MLVSRPDQAGRARWDRIQVFTRDRKGFLRVGNDRYGPLLAGQYVLSGQVKLTIKSEAGAPPEQIELASGTASFGIRDIDWGPAHAGVQMALAPYSYSDNKATGPVFGVVYRNSSNHEVALS